MRSIDSPLLAAFTLAALPAGLLGQTTLHARGSAVIDGVDGAGEWTDAATVTVEFTSGISGETSQRTFSLMSDDDNIYVSIRLPLDGADANDGFVLVVAASLDGVCPPRPTVDEHQLIVESTGFSQSDLFWSGGSGCEFEGSIPDFAAGGTTEGEGAASNEGSTLFLEIAIPLDTADDEHDLSAGVNQVLAVHVLAAACNGDDCGVPGQASRSFHLDVEHPIVFTDGFESGNTSAWGAEMPPLEAPDVYRWTDLDLRDPHVFANLDLFGCEDVTDTTPLGAQYSFNALVQQSIATDGDGDGELDFSQLLAFRPFDPLADAGRLDFGEGACAAPSPPASCDWRTPPPPRTVVYDGLAAGICLEPLPGTTHGYSPAIASAAAACYVSAEFTTAVQLLGATVPLHAVQSAAQFDAGVPPALLSPGLFLGFLRESDADAILITVPLLGTAPLSSYFPGGTGNCAAHNDLDTGPQGESGWWLYFNFVANPVSFDGR